VTRDRLRRVGFVEKGLVRSCLGRFGFGFEVAVSVRSKGWGGIRTTIHESRITSSNDGPNGAEHMDHGCAELLRDSWLAARDSWSSNRGSSRNRAPLLIWPSRQRPNTRSKCSESRRTRLASTERPPNANHKNRRAWCAIHALRWSFGGCASRVFCLRGACERST